MEERADHATQLQALFDEDASDLLLNVFDHLDVRRLLTVCAASCKRGREVCLQPPNPAPLSTPLFTTHAAPAPNLLETRARALGYLVRSCGCGIRGVPRSTIGVESTTRSWRSSTWLLPGGCSPPGEPAPSRGTRC
jgi:hypothetical protein